jgi:hypothetical protein
VHKPVAGKATVLVNTRKTLAVLIVQNNEISNQQVDSQLGSLDIIQGKGQSDLLALRKVSNIQEKTEF